MEERLEGDDSSGSDSSARARARGRGGGRRGPLPEDGRLRTGRVAGGRPQARSAREDAPSDVSHGEQSSTSSSPSSLDVEDLVESSQAAVGADLLALCGVPRGAASVPAAPDSDYGSHDSGDSDYGSDGGADPQLQVADPGNGERSGGAAVADLDKDVPSLAPGTFQVYKASAPANWFRLSALFGKRTSSAQKLTGHRRGESVIQAIAKHVAKVPGTLIVNATVKKSGKHSKRSEPGMEAGMEAGKALKRRRWKHPDGSSGSAESIDSRCWRKVKKRKKRKSKRRQSEPKRESRRRTSPIPSPKRESLAEEEPASTTSELASTGTRASHRRSVPSRSQPCEYAGVPYNFCQGIRFPDEIPAGWDCHLPHDACHSCCMTTGSTGRRRRSSSAGSSAMAAAEVERPSWVLGPWPAACTRAERPALCRCGEEGEDAGPGLVDSLFRGIRNMVRPTLPELTLGTICALSGAPAADAHCPFPEVCALRDTSSSSSSDSSSSDSSSGSSTPSHSRLQAQPGPSGAGKATSSKAPEPQPETSLQAPTEGQSELDKDDS